MLSTISHYKAIPFSLYLSKTWPYIPPALLLRLYFGVWVNSQGFRSHFNTFVGAENPILGHFETFTHQRLLAGVAFETLGSGMVKIPSMSAAIHLWGYLLFAGLTHLKKFIHSFSANSSPLPSRKRREKERKGREHIGL